MQLVWLCVYIHTSFEDTFENSLWGISSKCNLCDNASSQATHLRRHWKLHSGKIPDVTSVALHSLRQAIWGDIWKHTVRKSKCNCAFSPAGVIRTHTLKYQTNPWLLINMKRTPNLSCTAWLAKPNCDLDHSIISVIKCPYLDRNFFSYHLRFLSCSHIS